MHSFAYIIPSLTEWVSNSSTLSNSSNQSGICLNPETIKAQITSVCTAFLFFVLSSFSVSLLPLRFLDLCVSFQPSMLLFVRIQFHC